MRDLFIAEGFAPNININGIEDESNRRRVFDWNDEELANLYKSRQATIPVQDVFISEGVNSSIGNLNTENVNGQVDDQTFVVDAALTRDEISIDNNIN